MGAEERMRKEIAMDLKPKPNKRFVFTRRSLEALKPHDKNRGGSNGTEYSDTTCAGLKAISGPSGRIHFLHRFITPYGRKGSVALGEYLPGVTNIDEVRKKVYQQKAMLMEGRDPRDEKKERKGMLTFTEFAQEHYMPHSKQHKKTWKEDYWKIERALIPAFGSKRLDEITPRDMAGFHASEKERTSGVTANHMLRLLGRMLRLAQEWEFLKIVPTLPKKFKEKSRERFLSRDELGRFLRALDEIEDTGSVSAIRLLLYTGCRKTEILSLPQKHVHLDEGTIFLGDTKTGQSRTVHLSETAKKLLAEHMARVGEVDYVFPGKEGTFQRDIRKPFDRACREAGIQDFRIHDLRHTFASYAAVRSGIHSVSKVLGHSDTSMTARYAHHMNEELKKTADQAAEEMAKAAM